MRTLAVISKPFFRSLLAASLALILPQAVQSSGPSAVPVEVVRQGDGFALLRGGQPYFIRGVGMNRGDMAALAARGANSFRNWGYEDPAEGDRILDEAARHGLTVAMCLSIGRERHGFDYDDADAVARQFESARELVLRYKDHPALLLWIIGNEPDLQYTNPRVFDAINDISLMIHELDGNHPTTTALSDWKPELVRVVAERAPDLDLISLQKYADVVNVPRYIEQAGLDKPYLVTEWGPNGHWEVEKTSWGAPIEPSSAAKAASYASRYDAVIAAHPDRILGSYAFLWGQKQERTPTWYSMFLPDGSPTEVVDELQRIWTGEWPNERAPQVAGIRLDGRMAEQDVVLEAGAAYEAEAEAVDPNGDDLHYRWKVVQESEAQQVGGDPEEIPETMGVVADAEDRPRVTVTAPLQPGAYRLFVYVRDGRGKAGHANIPFQVR